MYSFRPARHGAGRIRAGVTLADDFQQPVRRRTQEAAAARDRDDVLAGREIIDADRRNRAEAQLFSGVALRQERYAETGLDQALLCSQAVDRRPVDLAEAMGL